VPFFGTGVIGCAIRKDAEARSKDLLFDFCAFTNLPEQSTEFVAKLGVIDSFRRSQIENKSHYLNVAKWNPTAYSEMVSIVSWGLNIGPGGNAGIDMRIQGTLEYQRQSMLPYLIRHIFGLKSGVNLKDWCSGDR